METERNVKIDEAVRAKLDAQAKDRGYEEARVAREMTVAEILTSRIERKQREISDLMQLRDSLDYNTREMGASRFERLARVFTAKPWE